MREHFACLELADEIGNLQPVRLQDFGCSRISSAQHLPNGLVGGAPTVLSEKRLGIAISRPRNGWSSLSRTSIGPNSSDIPQRPTIQPASWVAERMSSSAPELSGPKSSFSDARAARMTLSRSWRYLCKSVALDFGAIDVFRQANDHGE